MLETWTTPTKAPEVPTRMGSGPASQRASILRRAAEIMEARREERLSLAVYSGGVTLNGNVTFYGYVAPPRARSQST